MRVALAVAAVIAGVGARAVADPCAGLATRLAGALYDGQGDEVTAEALGVNAHVVVLKQSSDFPDLHDVEKVAAAAPGVTAAETFTFILAHARHGGAEVAIKLKGVEVDGPARMLDVGHRMVSGVADLRGADAPILLGTGVARTLGVGVGDTIDVVADPPERASSPTRPAVARRFRVAGTFHYPILVSEYDDGLAIATFAGVARLGSAEPTTGVELLLGDRDRAPAVATALQGKLGDAYHVVSWGELNKPLFDAIAASRGFYVVEVGLALASVAWFSCRR